MAKVFIQEDGGGDYTSLEDAVAANETDIEIQETWDNAEDAHLTIDDANTTIECTGAAKHPGHTNPGSETHYRLRPTGVGHTFTISAVTTVIGVDVCRTDEAGDISDEAFRMNANLTVKSCLVWMDEDWSGENQADGIHIDIDGGVLNVENSILYNWSRAGIHDQETNKASTINLNSSVIWNSGIGGHASQACCIKVANDWNTFDTINIFNSLLHIHSNGVACLCDDDTDKSTWVINDSISSDASITTVVAGGQGGSSKSGCLENRIFRAATGGGDEVLFQSITKDTEDLRLIDDAVNNDAQDMHANATGAGMNMPAADIVGTIRPQNTNYDVGAFEIVVAGWAGKVLGVSSPAKVLGVSNPTKVMGV